MNDIIFVIIFIPFVLAFISFNIGILINLLIYYSQDESKHPSFPLLNPFSFSTYELMFNSLLKLTWEVKGENIAPKRMANKLRKFSGILFLITILNIIISLILN